MPDEKDRLEELRARRAQREAAREAEEKRRELEELELEDRFEQECGPRGREFEIIDAVDGFVVVKRGEEVLHKKFMATMNGNKDPKPEDLYAYVSPCVLFPEKTTFDAMLGKRPHLATRCANALLTLHGFRSAESRGKF